jgi:periplasmic protein CpxP/Spy
MKSRFLSPLWIAICGSAIAIGLITIQPVTSQPIDVPNPPPANILKSLNLSDTQRQQIQAIMAKDQEARRAVMQELRTQEQELRTMMDGNTTREALLQKFNQVQGLRRQNEQRRFEQMLAMREILTPQQRSQLSQAVRSSMRNFRGQRRFPRPEN